MNLTLDNFPCGAARTSVRHAKALQHRPALWIQAIAANLLPRKSCPLEDERSQAATAQKAAQLAPAGPLPTMATSHIFAK